MSPMFRELYDEETFNNLYNFLKNVTEDTSDFYSESSKTRAVRILEKLNNYSRIEKDSADYEWVKVNWFGEELRDVLYMLLYTYKITPSKENKNWFEEMKIIYEETSDPIYQQKLKLQHFSPNVFSLSDENATLMRKTRNLLKFLDIPTNKLVMVCSDFPSKCWLVEKDYKTKQDSFDIYQTKDGWKIINTYRCKKENITRVTKHFINIETLEKTSETETKEYEEDDVTKE